MNYRGRVGESKITGNLQGHAAHRYEHDSAHPQAPSVVTRPATDCQRRGDRAGGDRLRQHRQQLLHPRRLRCRLAALTKTGDVLPTVVCQHMDGQHLGIHAGRGAALPCRLVSDRGALRRRSPVRQSRHQHRLPCGQLRSWWSRSRCMRRPRSPAATLAGVAVRTAPESGGDRGVDHRTRRFDARTLLCRVVRHVRTLAKESAAVRLYAWSVFWCFVALLSKQTAITLGPALVLYDVIVDRRQIAASWDWLRPYVPYVALTAAYLLLRYALFGEHCAKAL